MVIYLIGVMFQLVFLKGLFYVHYFALYIAILANADLPTLSSEVFHFGLVYAHMVMMPNYIIAIPM